MSDLPTGTVTFLFTDIEGSTRLVRELRASYEQVLAEHQQLLREAFARHGGIEIDTQGDAFMVAFARASDAVNAAVDGQRALAGYDWGDARELRVRMGIHTGQPRLENVRYTGLAVHRAARICAAAHGGQIALSQTTVNLLEDEEEPLPASRFAISARSGSRTSTVRCRSTRRTPTGSRRRSRHSGGWTSRSQRGDGAGSGGINA